MLTDTPTLIDQVASVKWWHQIELPGGITTPGVVDPRWMQAYSRLPERLDGMRVLDLGAADGYYSFWAEQHGALEVVAMDLWDGTGARYGYDVNGPQFKDDGFDIAHRALESHVIKWPGSAYDLDPLIYGRFDLVLMLGVIYHVKHQLIALEKVRSICRGRLIFETHLDLLGIPRPAVAFYEGSESADDDTNWWGGNIPYYSALLRTAGFVDVKFIGGSGLDSSRHLAEIQQARGTFHCHV